MATFIQENEVLKNRSFQVPKKMVTYLKQIKAKYGDINPQNKGTKRLNKLTDTTNEYNKRSDKNLSDSNTQLSYGDLKTIKHDFDHMSKDPNNLNRILNGGDKFQNWVNTTLNRERTAVKPIVDNNAKRNQEKAELKPVKNATKPIEIDGNDVRVHECKKIIITLEQKMRLEEALKK